MQNDKEIFELIKETYPLNPRDQFVSDTEKKLRKKARKIKRKMVVKRLSIASSGLVFCCIAMSWIFLFGGKEAVTNTFNSLGEEGLSSAAYQQEPSILIYHTHNKESFMPEINVKDAQDAFHDSKNVTLIGDRLSKKLKDRNISTIHDKSDISGMLIEKGLSFDQSYNVSRKIIRDVLENNKSIKMAFDIHRDSVGRGITTKSINGEDYARISFVISKSSDNFRKNHKFAELLHKKIEEKYPGLSRGVFVKSNEAYQSTYNQDVLDESVLLNIGGVENTLIEDYRTVDAFAEVIGEIVEMRN